MNSNGPIVIFTLLFLLAVFFICREIVCWYWKQNKIIELLTSIDNSLRNIKNPEPHKYDKEVLSEVVKKIKQ